MRTVRATPPPAGPVTHYRPHPAALEAARALAPPGALLVANPDGSVLVVNTVGAARQAARHAHDAAR